LPSSIKRPLRKVCSKAKINMEVTSLWMRHTFNNLLPRAKVDHIVLRASTGHQTEAMTEHYSHLGLEEKQEATARVLQMVGMG
jgi:site-specific recombinase XerD